MSGFTEELVGVFEGAAAKGSPARPVVGSDPVELADALLAKYAAGEWIDEERQRLVKVIARAEAEDAGTRA